MEIVSIVFIIYMVCFVISQFRKSDNPEGHDPATGFNGQHDAFASIRDSWLNNYNYRRASELMDSGDERQAYSYLCKALDDDPDNAFAHSLIGLIYHQHKVYGSAITAYTTAIRNTPESEHADFFVGRSRAYAGLGEEEAQLADLRHALDVEPGNTSALVELAQYHFCHGEYDESDRAIDKFLESEPNEVVGYMAKGRNEMMRGNWEHAKELFEHASNLDDTYAAAWSYEAEALMKQGKVSQAIDSVIRAFELTISDGNPDKKAVQVRNELARTACDLFCLKLKAKVVGGSQAPKWMYTLGTVYSTASRFVEAVQWYHRAYELDHDNSILICEAYCWYMAGNYAREADLLRQVLLEDPDNLQCMLRLAIALAEQGDYEAALSQCDELIRLQPDMANYYYNRARFRHILGRYEEAIDDYSTDLDLKDGDDANAHLYRGMAYMAVGDMQRSREDFLAIAYDADMKDREVNLSLVYSLLDDSPKALESLEKLEESLHGVSSVLPDYSIKALVLEAEALSRIGEQDKAIEKMREALELGACRFSTYRSVPETTELRKDCRFEELLREYESRVRESWTRGQAEPAETITRQHKENVQGTAASLIPFEKEGGVFKVPCRVNGLPLHFVFDTGASDVTISTVEATFMLKNGYLRKQDLCGSEYYMTANGEIAEGTAVRLREVDFGGMRLTNVKASVVRSQTAPLLLGQSVLQRLGRIEIDNVNRVIRVNQTELPQSVV